MSSRSLLITMPTSRHTPQVYKATNLASVILQVVVLLLLLLVLLLSSSEAAAGQSTHGDRLTVPVQSAVTVATPLAYGDSVVDWISGPTAALTYTFQAEANDLLFVGFMRTGGSPTFSPKLMLLHQDGTLLKWVSGSALGYTEITATLTTPGPYMLVICAKDQISSGQFTLQLQRLNSPPGATPITYGQTLTNTLALPTVHHLYTFQGNANDMLLVHVGWSKIGPDVQLYRSDGTLVNSASDWFRAVLTQTLPLTDVYTLMIGSHSGTKTGEYGIYLQRLNDPAGSVPITYGQMLTGTLQFPAQEHTYSFTGSPNEVLTVQTRGAISNPSMVPYIELYTTKGILLDTEQLIGFTTLTHTVKTTEPLVLVVSDWDADYSGAYVIHLQGCNDPPSAPHIQSGEEIVGAIEHPLMTHAFVFQATKQQFIRVTVDPGEYSFPAIHLFDPSGHQFASANGGLFRPSIDLRNAVTSEDGLQTLWIEDYLWNSTFSFRLMVQVSDQPFEKASVYLPLINH